MPTNAAVLILLAVLPACQQTPESEDSATGAPREARFGSARNAVVLVLDGGRIEETFGDEGSWGEGYSDAWGGPTDEVLPSMRSQLLPQGALARPGYISGATVTAPAHADLLTGVHRPMGPIPNADTITYFHPEYPTIFELVREQLDLEQDEAVLMGNTYHLSSLHRSTHPGYGELLQGTNIFIAAAEGTTPSEDDQDVLDEVRGQLEAGARLVVANLHQIDREGHNHPQLHARTIHEMDQPVTDLWNWIQSPGSGLADETLMVILSDHGRHRFEGGEYTFQDHGCDCSGCREVPMLLLGPWVQQGVVADSPVVLEDLSQTLAWLMGFDMPFGFGMVRSDLLGGTPEVPQPSGRRGVHGSGDLLGYQEATGGFSQRSEVWLDERLVSDEEAILVEAPRVLHTKEADFGCWRQLTLGTEAELWPWSFNCMRRRAGGDWEDIGFPEMPVAHHIAPSLAVDPDGSLYVSFAEGYVTVDGENPTSNVHDYRIRLVRWSERQGWEMADRSPTGAYFPYDPALAMDGESAWVAFSCSKEDIATSYSRHIEVHRTTWADATEPSWELTLDLRGDDDAGRHFHRMEQAGLWTGEDGVRLSFLGHDHDGVHVVVSVFEWHTGAWTTPTTLDASGRVLPYVTPASSQQGSLYWARLGEQGDDVEICRRQNPGESPSCQSTGRAHIDSLAPSDDGCWVSLSDGSGQWELEQLTW